MRVSIPVNTLRQGCGVVGMAQERDAVCPNCSAVRRTKAQPRTVVNCIACGRKFRAPAVPTPGPAPVPTPVGSDVEPAVVTGEPAPVGTGGLTVKRAKAVAVPQTARPRERGAEPAAEQEPAPEIPREPITPPPSHPQTERARRSGRRGGIAQRYREQVAGR